MKGIMRKLVKVGGVSALAILSSQVYAAGYRLTFQSASTLADQGDAAVVEDAATNWYNSAGLVYIPQQFVGAVTGVYAPTKFSGTATAPSPFGPAFSFTGTGSANSGTVSKLPAMHYAHPLGNQFAFGISVVPAWGLVEDYGRNSVVRYDLTRIYNKTIDIAPSLAAKLTDQWSLGMGLDFHYFSILSRNKVRTEGPALFGGTAGDSIARFSADRWGYGAHAGILYRLNEATRFGLNYRSKIVMDLQGYSSFAVDAGPVFETNQFGLKVNLPPVTTFSAYHDINPTWAIMGTLAYDQWSVLRRYTANNVQSIPSVLNPTGIIPTVFLPQKMHNTIDVAIGTHYRLNDQILLRGSLKYVPTPTRNQFRDINFPDSDKLGINIGGRYQYNKKLAFDAVYAHVFIKKTSINGLNPVTGATAVGHNTSHADILGAQVVYNI